MLSMAKRRGVLGGEEEHEVHQQMQDALVGVLRGEEPILLGEESVDKVEVGAAATGFVALELTSPLAVDVEPLEPCDHPRVVGDALADLFGKLGDDDIEGLAVEAQGLAVTLNLEPA